MRVHDVTQLKTHRRIMIYLTSHFPQNRFVDKRGQASKLLLSSPLGEKAGGAIVGGETNTKTIKVIFDDQNVVSLTLTRLHMFR